MMLPVAIFKVRRASDRSGLVFPGTGTAIPAFGRDAVQLAVVPPPLPAQVQLQGPLPLTVEVVPALHRLAAGADKIVVPLEVPHAPLTRLVASGGGGMVP